MTRLGTIALLWLYTVSLLGAGVVLDGSLGTRGALPGPNFVIPATVGRQVGGNLFQSFSQFDLNNTQSATFTGPANVQNILSRVTGGSPSSIDGKVSSQIQGANLFFLNPAGVIFGPHAQLDASGSVAISTANYVKTADGGRFNANLGGGDTLTSAPVSSFGFLNPTPAGVSISGSNTRGAFFDILPGPGLNLSPGKTISIISGDIGINAGYISGIGSAVNLISVRSAGEVQLDATKLSSAVDVSQFSTLGNVQLTNLSLIDTSGPGGGPVSIYAGNLLLDKSELLSRTRGPVQGGSIKIAVSGNLHIINDNFLNNISTDTSGSGDAGQVDVTAKSVTLDRGSVTSGTSGSGAGGDVNVTAQSVTLENNSIMTATTGLRATGKGGNVTIMADTLQLTNCFHGLDTSTQGGGNGGNIKVIARSVTLEDAQFEADANSTGNGGTITVVANILALTTTDPANAESRFGADASASGAGGDINVTAASITLDKGAFATDTLGSGVGGNIHVTAGSLTLDNNAAISAACDNTGNGGTVTLVADTLLLNFGIISTSSFNFSNLGVTGNAGSINLTANNLLRIVDGSKIESSTRGPGNAGDVVINATSAAIDGAGARIGATGIFAASRRGSHGKGGSIVVTGGQLSLQNGGAISASSFTAAPAGSVTLGPADSPIGALSINSGGFISSANTGDGPAGSVSINASGPVTLRHGSSISVASRLSGAGGIDLFSDGVIKLSGGSSITASAGTDGGNIHLKAPDLVYLKSSSITAEAGREKNGSSFGGMGGNITIDPRFIILKDSVISANAAAGQGGNINLISDFFFNSGSFITATGTTNNGTVNITAPELDLGAELITLPSSLVDVESQLQERCTALLQGDYSSIVTVGRGGTEPPPDELQTEF